MANGIFFSDDEMNNIKLGPVQVDKVYLGQTLVYPISTSGPVLTLSISNMGSIKGTSAGNYAAVQRSTDGSGSGATFSITLGTTGLIFGATAINSITATGTGYEVGDLITLDYTSISELREQVHSVLEVLTIS